MGLGIIEQNAWLFARENESVYMQVEQPGTEWRLLVLGPGRASASYSFFEPDGLVRFRESFERELLASGFRLQATAERRGGRDRRGRPRADTRDRRR
jgi:hypothetical protein